MSKSEASNLTGQIYRTHRTFLELHKLNGLKNLPRQQIGIYFAKNSARRLLFVRYFNEHVHSSGATSGDEIRDTGARAEGKAYYMVLVTPPK
jgi:hypothetical protein